MSGIQYAGEYEVKEARIFSSSGNIIPLDGLLVGVELFENVFSYTITI